jgi:hypothetical protein
MYIYRERERKRERERERACKGAAARHTFPGKLKNRICKIKHTYICIYIQERKNTQCVGLRVRRPPDTRLIDTYLYTYAHIYIYAYIYICFPY